MEVPFERLWPSSDCSSRRADAIVEWNQVRALFICSILSQSSLGKYLPLINLKWDEKKIFNLIKIRRVGKIKQDANDAVEEFRRLRSQSMSFLLIRNVIH